MNRGAKGLVIAILLLVSACGSTKTSTSPAPTSTLKASSSAVTPLTTPNGEPLLAVLESKLPASQQQADTVAIAGLDGFARAKATFTPIRPPIMRFTQNGQVLSFPLLLPPQAYVAGDQVYFLDGTGVIRSLSVSNSLRNVISLPKTSDQQLVSYAVSPDGTRILGTVLSIPPGPQGGGASLNINYDVFSGPTGGTATLVRHGVGAFSINAAAVPELIAWGDSGPLGTLPSEFFPQGGPPGRWHGTVVRLDSGAQSIGAVGTTDCRWEDQLREGDLVCLGETDNGTKVVVNKRNGSQVWSHLNPPHAYSDPVLAPDGKSAAVRRQKAQDLPDRVFEGCFVLDSTGGEMPLPAGFIAIGWATSSILIGATTSATDPGSWPTFAPLSYVQLTRPSIADPLGFNGIFIGGVPLSG
jgi:hypothetical protein